MADVINVPQALLLSEPNATITTSPITGTNPKKPVIYPQRCAYGYIFSSLLGFILKNFITRFISKSELKDSFNRFFGTNEWEKAIGLTGRERETFLVNIFKNKIKDVTGAKFVFPYRLCYPDKDQTYYYLIHATNHIDGITLMKEAFASVNNGRVQYLGKHNNDISLLDLDCFKADEI